MAKVKRIDIQEFRELGYLQEVNRLMLHPLGLALEVVIVDDPCFSCAGEGVFNGVKCNTCDGSGNLHIEHLGGIWDYRDDPEGILFGTGEIEQEKVDQVAAAFQEKVPAREKLLGDGIFIQSAEG